MPDHPFRTWAQTQPSHNMCFVFIPLSESIGWWVCPSGHSIRMGIRGSGYKLRHFQATFDPRVASTTKFHSLSVLLTKNICKAYFERFKKKHLSQLNSNWNYKLYGGECIDKKRKEEFGTRIDKTQKMYVFCHRKVLKLFSFLSNLVLVEQSEWVDVQTVRKDYPDQSIKCKTYNVFFFSSSFLYKLI